MIQYQSTRGEKKLHLFSEAVLKGIASDGGLFVPTEIPQFKLEDLKNLLDKSYQERAGFVLNLFKTDFPEAEIKEMVNQAYADNFRDPQVAPLVKLKRNLYLLELWHGPTSAFKDMALQIMPLFFEAAARKNQSAKYLILTATSGDTGKAALEGFKDKEGISIAVFYPEGLVSKLQELQMQTQDGKNVLVASVKSDFDGVQRLVKELFGNREFNLKLEKDYTRKLSSANSINWGRLMPQIIYHISGYLDLVNLGRISLGDQIDIAVPTGNFGNILGAFYAKKMGLPVGKLICASNENNVLSDFLQTGVYDIKNRKLVKTPSPSMDILVASNIERLLYELSGVPQKVSEWMNQLKTTGRFEVDEETKQKLQEVFYAGWSSNNQSLGNIKKTFDETGYLMDPHTSVGQFVAEKYLQETGSNRPVIICSTAHWAKFGTAVYQALFKEGLPEDEFAALEKIRNLNPKLQIPKSLSSLQNQKPIHKDVIESDLRQAEELLIKFIR